jgi:transaldolase
LYFLPPNIRQAIAYHELIRVDSDGKPVHGELIQASIEYAKTKKDVYAGVTVAEVAVECMMVRLALRIVPYLKGYSHIQTNPNYAYNKQKTIENARRKSCPRPRSVTLVVTGRRRCADLQGN